MTNTSSIPDSLWAHKLRQWSLKLLSFLYLRSLPSQKSSTVTTQGQTGSQEVCHLASSHSNKSILVSTSQLARHLISLLPWLCTIQAGQVIGQMLCNTPISVILHASLTTKTGSKSFSSFSSWIFARSQTVEETCSRCSKYSKCETTYSIYFSPQLTQMIHSQTYNCATD